MDNHSFSGSYNKNEVCFLLKPMLLPDTPVHLKEKLIQSGQRHYSQLLTHEQPPAVTYSQIFQHALLTNRLRLAVDLFHLAEQIITTRQHPIVLVSLARAGTPIGVLLKHLLAQHYSINVPHYSISILRDIGIDQQALRYLLQFYAPESLVFIDGWTGKGSIAKQLTQSLQAFAVTDDITIAPHLYVLADLCGDAAFSATTDDYLIPSCILNATVSGLVSRSFYHQEIATSGCFHGCVYYQHLEPYDASKYFIDTVSAVFSEAKTQVQTKNRPKLDHTTLQRISTAFLKDIAWRYGVSQYHYIKPGIGEATRVLLRRKARLLLLKDTSHESTQHLRWLAEQKSVPIQQEQDLPYQAAALISEVLP